MKKVFNEKKTIAYLFGDLSYGGSNIQGIKTIQYSGYLNDCIIISLKGKADKRFIEFIKKNNILYYELDLNKFEFIFSAINKVKRILKSHDCRLLHTNGLVSDTIGHYASKKIEHVITLHNYLKEDALTRMPKFKAKIAIFIQKIILKRSNNIVTCSKSLKKLMLNDFPYLKITDIQNGVEIEKYAIGCEKTHNFVEKICFAVIASISKRKRIDETINAFIKCKLSPNIKLLIIGNGSLLKELKLRYEAKNVIFLGERNDITNLFHYIDYTISSSESEGLPLGILESLAAKKPVILSDIPQHCEILDEFPNDGILYELGNIDQLSEIIKDIVNKKILFNEFETIQNSSFDIHVMGEKYYYFYNKLINNRKDINS